MIYSLRIQLCPKSKGFPRTNPIILWKPQVFGANFSKICHQVYRPEFATFRVEDKDGRRTFPDLNLGPGGFRYCWAKQNRWGLCKEGDVCEGNRIPGGGVKYFCFTPKLGADFQFDKCFSDGLKPPRDVLTEKLLRSCNASTFFEYRLNFKCHFGINAWAVSSYKKDRWTSRNTQVQEIVRTAWNVFTVWMCGISVDDRGDWTWLICAEHIIPHNMLLLMLISILWNRN